ncbi:MAG: NAD(P)H-dependent glycerol-3-phosphate dehydrogenase [Clostridia bacterium]|nr:NAD(P)H-dependent glycerol-3-phosphate dehydrogenase [Clostridia bacterium]
MNISVIGCGRWGTFITWYLSNHGHQVVLWGRTGSEKFNSLKQTRKNEYVSINENVLLTDDLSNAVKHAQIIIISISSQSLREFMSTLSNYNIKDKIILLCMKGVECDSGKRLTEVVLDYGVDKNKVAVWVGPGHIQDFVSGYPNCMVIDSYSQELTKMLADSFRTELIRFYYGNDVIGSEIGAAAKNVMGIAAGMLDGGGFSTLKGPLMARGAYEVAKLIKAMGGDPLSAYGLCHLGDYETTLFSEHSHNRKFGECYVKNLPFTKLAEGVSTCKSLKLLGEKFNVDMPITNAVYSILYDKAEPMEVLLGLFSRSTRIEFNL